MREKPLTFQGLRPSWDRKKEGRAKARGHERFPTHRMSFLDLGLSPEVCQAVADAGYTTPTPIQAAAIPQVLMGRDVLATAQTGTGKTAAFTLPMIDILAQGRAKARMPRSLILEPTRELADQVATNFEKYGKHHKLSMALLIGGVSFGDQEKIIDRGVDVLIATPGRLLDHFERGKVMLNGVKTLVIDEADRMMDMGFMPDVERIVKLLPPLRQTLFFSATMAADMRRLADQFLTNPKEISVAPPASPATNVVQGLAVVPDEDKREALRRLIRAESVKNAIIFCNRKRDVDILYKSLVKHGFNAGALHGDMVQSVRMETLAKFKAGEITLLVASDVAARGLDVQGLSHVFNFDVPIHSEDYVHRIGRTGRAGLTGRAFTLATPDDGRFVVDIEKLIAKEIPRIEIDGIETVAFEEGDGRRRRGRRGAAPKREGRAEGRSERPRRERSRKEHADAPAVEAAPPQERVRRERPRKEHREPAAAAPEPIRQHPSQQGAEPIPLRPRQKQPEPRPEHRGRRDDAREPRVVGLGDHVPAFLLRPVRATA